jgi:hypothetical protein
MYCTFLVHLSHFFGADVAPGAVRQPSLDLAQNRYHFPVASNQLIYKFD